MAPAVERVQKAHCLFFILCRTALHDRADQHFDEAAADGIDDDSDQQPHIGISCQFRQENKPQKSGCRTDISMFCRFFSDNNRKQCMIQHDRAVPRIQNHAADLFCLRCHADQLLQAHEKRGFHAAGTL